MTLSIPGLKADIKTELENEFGVADDPNILDKYANAIAKAVINHFEANAIINTTVTGTTGIGPPGGPLPIVTQPGIGTIT